VEQPQINHYISYKNQTDCGKNIPKRSTDPNIYNNPDDFIINLKPNKAVNITTLPPKIFEIMPFEYFPRSFL